MKLSNALKLYARKLPTPVQLNLLKSYGKNISKDKMINQSVFLKEELPIRLCHRVFDLLKLPYGLPTIPEINYIVDLYSESFDRIMDFRNPDTIDKAEEFTNLLEDIKIKHTDVEKILALGIKKLDNPLVDFSIINTELDKFFLSRIGIRTLISHHIETVKHSRSLIRKCAVDTIVNDATEEVSAITSRIYGTVPTFVLNDNNSVISYIPEYIYYPVFEILKNSIVAHYMNNKIYSPVNITIGEGKGDIIIKISDEGMGFPYNKLKDVMTYSYSTTSISNIDNNPSVTFNNGNTKPIISGFGFGLPMSKTYCKYFGGDLCINPIEGIGTDVFIYINKLGERVEEL